MKLEWRGGWNFLPPSTPFSIFNAPHPFHSGLKSHPYLFFQVLVLSSVSGFIPAFKSMLNAKLKVLVVAQTPPPHHGQAVMTEYFLSGSYQHIELLHIRMAFSREIDEVGRAGLGKVLHLFALIFQIIQARIRHKPDVLYYPPASPNLVPFLRDCIILICTRWMFQKTAFHFHANGISEFRLSLPRSLQRLYRKIYGCPDLSICLSELATQDARDFNSRHIALVPNGIPDCAESNAIKVQSAERPTILYLGTVSRDKGAGCLLDTLALLVRKKYNFRCMVAGAFASIEEEKTLKQKCAFLELNDWVLWRGAIYGREKWDCYQKADVFCFPSYYKTEGFPVVLLEAMMFSLPCISTQWRAIPEIIQEGETGFLVPIKDPVATADRLAQLLSEPEMRHEMGRAGRKRFLEKYTVNIFRENMEKALTGDF